MNRQKLTAAALALGAVAALALGQNAGNNSAGPTRNDYRLRLVEPAEGSTVTGSTVRVVVNTEIPSDIEETRRDVNSMPRPDVDVFLDEQIKGTMRDANNVMTIDGVALGRHTIVLLAKNRAGEIIDRKEVHFSSTADMKVGAASGSTTRQDTTLEPADHHAAPADTSLSVRPAPASTLPPAPKATTQSTMPRTAAQMAADGPPPVAPAHVNRVAEAPRPRRLPATATRDPLLFAAGALLLLGGLGLRRLG